MKCPNCSQVQQEHAAECPACGVIFAKWKAGAEGAPAAARPAPDASDAPGQPLALAAVLKGAVVGAVASIIESSVVAIPFMSGVPRSAEEAEAMVKVMSQSTSYLLTDLSASMVCMALGGYVAAGSAGHSGTKHGAVTGVLLFLFVGAMFLMAPRLTPVWYTAVVFTLIIPAAAFGGMIR